MANYNQQRMTEPSYHEESMFENLPLQQHDDSIKWRIDPTPILEQLERSWKGEILDFISGTYIKKNKPIMKEEGINELISIIRSRVSSATVQANLKDKQIARIVYETSEEVRDFIVLFNEKYNIDPSKFQQIVLDVEHFVEIFLSRTKDDLEREHLAVSQKYVEHHNQEPPQNKKKFKLFGW